VCRSNDLSRERIRVTGEFAARPSTFHQVNNGCTIQRFSADTHHFREALIKYPNAAICVEHAETLGHILECCVEREFLMFQLVMGALEQLGAVTRAP
jgi:hypothetical protein